MVGPCWLLLRLIIISATRKSHSALEVPTAAPHVSSIPLIRASHVPPNLNVATRMPKIFITLLCALFSTVAARSADSWKEYTNGRFGFLLRYPGTLLASREPDSGDGREFHTPDKEFSVVALGHFLISDAGDSLEKRWQDDLKSLGDTITYKKKTATWYVVSGVAKNGTESQASHRDLRSRVLTEGGKRLDLECDVKINTHSRHSASTSPHQCSRADAQVHSA